MSRHVDLAEGWYEDPAEPGWVRFYDGSTWGDLRLAATEVPRHRVRAAPAGVVPQPAASPEEVTRAPQEPPGLSAVAAAWLVLVLAAGALAADAADGGWSVGVLAAAYPCSIVTVMGLRVALHGLTRVSRALGVVTAVVAAPGAAALLIIVTVFWLVRVVMVGAWALLAMDPLEYLDMFRVRDPAGGIDGAHGAWLASALGWCAIWFAMLR